MLVMKDREPMEEPILFNFTMRACFPELVGVFTKDDIKNYLCLNEQYI